METLDSRIRSFSKPKGKSSARAWPHPNSWSANPSSLAEAGFFFKPSKEDPDNVRCFICKKELAGWDENDNPFEIHVDKCPKCPWAIARCALEFDVDADGQFAIKDPARVPSNKALEKARADTFGGKKWWPHDAVKNHGATSKKMAKAGFVYTPQTEGDDTATCFYCDLSLSGWDAEDDPTEEHLKRVERSGKPCPFFQVTEPERPKSQASTRSTRSTSRKSRAPKHIETDEDEERITVKAPAKRGRPPGPSKKPISKLSSAENSEELEEDDDPSLKVPQAVRKAGRKPTSKSKPPSRATSKSKSRTNIMSKGVEQDDEVMKTGEEAKENELEKPPSNVDGMVTKPYRDFAVMIDIPKADDKHGNKAPRGRSRSQSKPRSTSTTKPSMLDTQSKPLLRAASRSRTSGITEIEERETEAMLAAVSPSEGDQEEKEKDKKPTGKARGRKKKKAAQTATEGDDSAPQIGETLSSSGKDGDERMDVDEGEKAVEEEANASIQGPGPEQEPEQEPTFPAPASPSDFKTVPSSTIEPRKEQVLPAIVHPQENEKEKEVSNATAFPQALEVPPSPAELFIPPLARSPLRVVAALTEEERRMTVEEWIRHEMRVQYERLKEDGERRIREFVERAEETRRRIEAM